MMYDTYILYSDDELWIYIIMYTSWGFSYMGNPFSTKTGIRSISFSWHAGRWFLGATDLGNSTLLGIQRHMMGILLEYSGIIVE